MKSLASLGALALVTGVPLSAQAGPPVEIGSYDAATGEYTVFEDRLLKTFEDGGPITSFEIQGPPSSPMLFRSGRDDDDRCFMDGIPLDPIGGGGSSVTFTEHLVPIRSVCQDNENADCSSQVQHPWQDAYCKFRGGCVCMFWLTNDVATISAPETYCVTDYSHLNWWNRYDNVLEPAFRP